MTTPKRNPLYGREKYNVLPGLSSLKKKDEVAESVERWGGLYNKEFTCFYCRKNYKGQDNIGALDCIPFHPGAWNGSVYMCCDSANLKSTGCAISDHTPKEHLPFRYSGNRHIITVPYDESIVPLIKTKYEKILPLDQQGSNVYLLKVQRVKFTGPR